MLLYVILVFIYISTLYESTFRARLRSVGRLDL